MAKDVTKTSDLTVYDKFVTDLAKKAGIGGSWKVLADGNVGAKKHTDTDPKTADHIPIFLIDGESMVAKNYRDLWKGPVAVTINRTETGEVLTEGFVATGANAWSFGREKGVRGGNLAKGPSNWWNWKRRGDGHVYAISGVLEVKAK